MNWIRKKVKKFGESLKKYTKRRPSKNEQGNADWITCPSCKKLQYKNDLGGDTHFICSCNYHFDYPAKLRLKNIFDNGVYEDIPAPPADPDPLNFKVSGAPYISKRKKYEEDLIGTDITVRLDKLGRLLFGGRDGYWLSYNYVHEQIRLAKKKKK